MGDVSCIKLQGITKSESNSLFKTIRSLMNKFGLRDKYSFIESCPFSYQHSEGELPTCKYILDLEKLK